MDWIQNYLKSHRNALLEIGSATVHALIGECEKARKRGSNIFVIGNGGSAANASHFAEDLGKGANDAVGEPPFRVISLCDSVPYITAIGNDYCFEDIYLRQLVPLAQKDDLLIGISVSGTSPNLVKAFRWAGTKGLRKIALTGRQARDKIDSIYALADLSIVIPSTHYGIVEDCQMTLCHMVCYFLMENKDETVPV